MEVFSSIASLLTKLTQKKVKFKWSDDYEKSFAEFKTKWTTTPILTLLEGQMVMLSIVIHPESY